MVDTFRHKEMIDCDRLIEDCHAQWFQPRCCCSCSSQGCRRKAGVSSANWKQENHEDWSVVSNMEYVDYVFVVVVGEGRLLLDDNLKVRDELSHMFRPPPARLHVPN